MHSTISFIDFNLSLRNSVDDRQQIVSAIDLALNFVNFIHFCNYDIEQRKVDKCF